MVIDRVQSLLDAVLVDPVTGIPVSGYLQDRHL